MSSKGFYRNKHGHVIIQYYDPTHKRSKKIPRKEIKHLDSLPNDQVEKWVDCWMQEHIKTTKVINKLLLETDEAAFLFRQFLIELKRLKNLEQTTIDDNYSRFINHAVPFFVGENGEKDVRNWSFLVPHLPMYLLENSALSISQKRKIIGLVLRFSKYLTKFKVIPYPWIAEMPSEGSEEGTPLPKELKPEEVLNKVDSCEDRRIKLMMLVGFFANLRPCEMFVLLKEDFYTGESAVELSKTYHRFADRGLGSKLAIYINKSASRKSKVKTKKPKTKKSKGYVTIWSIDAALRIGAILKEFDSGPIFDRARDTLFKDWREKGFPLLGVKLHDMRRAGGLYLGRYLDLPVTLVQDHLRHARLSTTEKYMRHPEEEISENAVQNFDDVA